MGKCCSYLLLQCCGLNSNTPTQQHFLMIRTSLPLPLDETGILVLTAWLTSISYRKPGRQRSMTSFSTRRSFGP